MFYDGYHWAGMHLLWWLLWVGFFLFVFATPYDIPGERRKKDSPLDILKRRFASGELTNEEYLDKKKLL